jgi:hypothetical protein
MEPNEFGPGYDFDAFEMVDQAMMGQLSRRQREVSHTGANSAAMADALVTARLAARRADALVQDKLAAIEAFGADTFPEHTVIRFGKTMPNRTGEPQTYTYAAIKVVGHWYTTGPKGQRYTWDELLVWLVSGEWPTLTFEVLQHADDWPTAIKMAPATLSESALDSPVFGNHEKYDG